MNLFAFTSLASPYPEYISVKKLGDHSVKIAVRSPPAPPSEEKPYIHEGTYAAMTLDRDQLGNLHKALSKELRLPIVDAAAIMYAELVREVDALMGAKAGTPEAEKLSRLAEAVQAYEDAKIQMNAA